MHGQGSSQKDLSTALGSGHGGGGQGKPQRPLCHHGPECYTE